MLQSRADAASGEGCEAGSGQKFGQPTPELRAHFPRPPAPSSTSCESCPQAEFARLANRLVDIFAGRMRSVQLKPRNAIALVLRDRRWEGHGTMGGHQPQLRRAWAVLSHCGEHEAKPAREILATVRFGRPSAPNAHVLTSAQGCCGTSIAAPRPQLVLARRGGGVGRQSPDVSRCWALAGRCAARTPAMPMSYSGFWAKARLESCSVCGVAVQSSATSLSMSRKDRGTLVSENQLQWVSLA